MSKPTKKEGPIVPPKSVKKNQPKRNQPHEDQLNSEGRFSSTAAISSEGSVKRQAKSLESQLIFNPATPFRNPDKRTPKQSPSKPSRDLYFPHTGSAEVDKRSKTQDEPEIVGNLVLRQYEVNIVASSRMDGWKSDRAQKTRDRTRKVDDSIHRQVGLHQELEETDIVTSNHWTSHQLLREMQANGDIPPVDCNSVLIDELERFMPYCDRDIHQWKTQFSQHWNLKVNYLLERSGLAPSEFKRAVASLLLSKLGNDMEVARKCLMDDTIAAALSNEHTFIVDLNVGKEILDDIITKVYQYPGDLNHDQKCEICWDTYSANKIFGLSCCECIICNDCMRRYFVSVIGDGHAPNFVCPSCRLPEMEDATLHFQLLEPKLKFLLPKNEFAIYQRKMTEWNLMRNPNFRWCINADCGYGFLIPENANSRVICPECRQQMCHRCQKEWENQHEGLTCEEFKKLKENNDNEACLVQQLQENGIDCPQCGRRYWLSKGGCIHFTCLYCRYEFCSDCSRPFVKSCKKRRLCYLWGLHCHHPRNCLYYLRDRSVDELQELLQRGDVEYDVSTPGAITVCRVLEQKDLGVAYDEMCRRAVPVGHAGLCEMHYKEYLVGLIQEHRIDPVWIMSKDELIRELHNFDLHDFPKRQPSENLEQYRTRLAKLVMAKIALWERD